MEKRLKVQTFVVDIDLTDVNLLYDYGHGEYIHKKTATMWDIKQLVERSQDDYINEASKMCKLRVDMMDYVLEQKQYVKDGTAGVAQLW